MNKRANGKDRVVFSLLLAIVFMFASLGAFDSRVYAQGVLADQKPPFALPTLQPSVSSDGLTLTNGVPPLVIVADPNQSMQGIQFPDDPVVAEALVNPEAASATFSITFVAAGGHDPWGATCLAFPTAAKTAFTASAAIWAETIQSPVPIRISACWANLGSSTVLGYSGNMFSFMDFSGAPKSGVWYESALADALHGSYLDPSDYDDYITYNSLFPWYYGTDGHPTAGKYDLVTVAAGEIGHGLNFSGTATYSRGTGQFGMGAGTPNIYDWFMEDATGAKLTSYTNNSTALGSLFTSNNLWFNGAHANAANGGGRVRIYAPPIWASGSSYSHLDYTTYAETANSMMLSAVSAAFAQHNPGPVTKGILQDMGWNLASPTVPTLIAPAGNLINSTPTFIWSVIPEATNYTLAVYKGTTLKYSKTVDPSACGASSCAYTPTTVLSSGSYSWKVRAYAGGVYKSYSASMAFTEQTNLPFDTEFTSSSSGWTPLKGTWSVGGGTYQTTGYPNAFASVVHSSYYNMFTFETSLKHQGCVNCYYGIYFNGTPQPLDTGNGIWREGYMFLISDDGYYSILVVSGGVPFSIINWTSTPAITSGFNVLKVTYNYTSGLVQFFINGTSLVTGSFSSHPLGQVGITVYSDASRGNKLYVDYAKVSLIAPSSSAAGDSPSINDANPVIAAPGSVKKAPRR